MSRAREESDNEDRLHPRRSKRRATGDVVDTFQTFTKDVQTAVNKVIPTRSRRYEQAAILAISFSRSDIPSIITLRDQLLDILGKTYGWAVETYEIDCEFPDDAAGMALMSKITDFVFRHMARTRGGGPHLQCIYYSGHGYRAGDDQQLTLCGSFDGVVAQSPTIKWNKVARTLEVDATTNNHHLVMMDCCVAGLAHLGDKNVEVIAASAWESYASDEPSSSFTQALITELEKLGGDAISTSQLVARLHSIENARDYVSMPVYKHKTNDSSPAIIHKIEKSPAPTRQTKRVPKYAHVLIDVKVSIIYSYTALKY